jgi:hypothetical protein
MLKTMRYLTLSLLILFMPAGHADVYRSVDENGNVVYSDHPSKGAEKIEIKDAQTIHLPSAGPFKYQPPPKEAPPRYSTVAISHPGNDESIRQNSGDITVQVAVNPGLKPGDVISLLMDGKEVASGPATSVTLKNVDRGSHTLQARVVGSDGSTWLSSESVTFHLLRHTVLQPKPPPGPLNPPTN